MECPCPDCVDDARRRALGSLVEWGAVVALAACGVWLLVKIGQWL